MNQGFLRTAAGRATLVLLLAGGIGSEALPQGPQGRGRGGAPAGGEPPSAQASATVDLTGYRVSLVTEDWHWRMSVPEKGDVSSIPFTNDEEKRAILEAWDPVRDEAEGNACKAYGAAAIMRVPTRVHITWESENVLRLDTDAGMQTRLFRFGEEADREPGERTWQGFSRAEWDSPPGGRGRGGFGGRGGRGAPPAGPPPADGDAPPPTPPDGAPPGLGRGARGGPTAGGSLKVVTTNMRSGYLRKNGVPYSEETSVTEYFHRTEEDYGNTYMIVTTIVEDPEFLTTPFITSSHFRKLPDTDNGWTPTPCSAL